MKYHQVKTAQILLKYYEQGPKVWEGYLSTLSPTARPFATELLSEYLSDIGRR
jgi:hypothetical protein